MQRRKFSRRLKFEAERLVHERRVAVSTAILICTRMSCESGPRSLRLIQGAHYPCMVG